MDRFRNLARKLVEAAALGLLATAVLYLPPLRSIAVRLDAWLFDIWSQLDPPPPDSRILVAEADTAADLARIATLAARQRCGARRQHAAEPPSAASSA